MFYHHERKWDAKIIKILWHKAAFPQDLKWLGRHINVIFSFHIWHYFYSKYYCVYYGSTVVSNDHLREINFTNSFVKMVVLWCIFLKIMKTMKLLKKPYYFMLCSNKTIRNSSRFFFVIFDKKSFWKKYNKEWYKKLKHRVIFFMNLKL